MSKLSSLLRPCQSATRDNVLFTSAVFFSVVMETDLQQRRKVSVLAAAFRGSELHLLFENDSDAPRRLRIDMKGWSGEIPLKLLEILCKT